MGSELFAIVTAKNLDVLSGPAYHCLVAMAVVARDRDTKASPARLYFGGWEWLARAALHRPSPYDLADKQAVGRAIRELIDLGLIKRRGRIAGQQSTVVYELTL
jgi:hypothetical protein